ncbi:MAG: helix-turn-helix domain-containing protein [Candidatus Limivicinus sp.]
MTIDYSVIGRRIKQGRIAAGLTQEQTAEAADITAIYLSKIENGRVEPTLNTLGEICAVLNLDIGVVLSGCQPQRSSYENDTVTRFFNACSPQIKPVALKILKELSEIK